MGNDPVNNIDPDGGETDPPSTQSPGGKSSPSSGNIYMDGPYKKGFWSGFADGFGGGAMSTWNTIKGLATFDANTWKGLAQSTIDMASIVTMNPHGMMLANQYASSAISYAQNIPNMSSYEIGYGVGYGTEKITEVALLRYGRIGFPKEGVLGLSIGRAEMSFMYKFNYGVSFRYTTSSSRTFAFDWHTLPHHGYAKLPKVHIHYRQPNIWSIEHHLDLGLLRQNLQTNGLRWYDFFKPLPSKGYKNTNLYRSLDASKMPKR